MGDRVSISFVTRFEDVLMGKGKKQNMIEHESVALFSHWGGREFVKQALAYANALVKEVGDEQMNPLDRFEPNTVLLDFVRHITHDMKRVTHNYYLGVDHNDGDNSDNGHFRILLQKGHKAKLLL